MTELTGFLAKPTVSRPALAGAARSIAAVLVALILVAGLLELLGANPASAFDAMLSGALGSAPALGQTTMIASVLALTGIAAAVPFSARLFNIGGAGQAYAGAIAATATAFAFPGLPQSALVPLLLLAGVAAGAMWAAIPGVMKAYFDANEVIVSLMLSFVAGLLAEFATLNLWPSGLGQSTIPLPSHALLPTLSAAASITLGAPLAVVTVAVIWVLMSRTSLGFEIRAVGLNAVASAVSGVRVRRIQVLAFVTGGAAAGLGGAILVAGIQDSLIGGSADTFGFLGIAVALVARLSIAWIVPSAALFAALQVGSNSLQVQAGISPAMGEVIVGVLVIALLALGAIRVASSEADE